MIITRTPYRLSLFGGGTDYPQWSCQHGGAVIGFAIDKYCYLSVRPLPPFFEHKHRVVYSRIETVTRIEDIQHPAVRAVLMDQGVSEGLEIHHDGDLPARSGLGSSSSFTVGLLNALYALRGRMVTKRELAEEAVRIEQRVIVENVGSQDQIWAAYGGCNRIEFLRNGDFSVRPIIMTRARAQELVSHVMLVFTGVSRIASQVAGDKIANLPHRTTHLIRMRAMVDEAQEILTTPRRSLHELGALLHEGWRLKRELAATVSTPRIDDIYQAAREAGALGGKLLGAGGGGFMALLVEPERRATVRERLTGLIDVAVDMDTSGSTVVVYQPRGFI